MDRIDDPRLQAILENVPPQHIGVYLRKLFGAETSGPFKQLGTVEGFLAAHPGDREALYAVLEERDLLEPELAAKLTRYFGLADDGLFIRVQQSSFVDRQVKN